MNISSYDAVLRCKHILALLCALSAQREGHILAPHTLTPRLAIFDVFSSFLGCDFGLAGYRVMNPVKSFPLWEFAPLCFTHKKTTHMSCNSEWFDRSLRKITND